MRTVEGMRRGRGVGSIVNGPRALTRRTALALIAAAVAAGAVATPAFAQDGREDLDQNDQIVLTGRLIVPSDDTVDAAVIFDGDALVEGTVRESLVVLNGDAEISGTVNEDVVVLNGDVVVRASAEIGGDLMTRGEPTVEDGATIRGERGQVVTSFDLEGLGLAGRFAWWIGYSVSVLVLGLLMLLFVRRLGDAVRRVSRERTGASIGWGIGLFFLLPLAAVLLLVTIVGIPLGIITLLALALIYTVGYAVATVAVGGLILRSGSTFATFFVGWAVLRLLALIPVAGGVLWLAGSIWGLGLLAVVIREGTTPERAIPPTPPPPPVPAVT
jgi:hypothetical protein